MSTVEDIGDGYDTYDLPNENGVHHDSPTTLTVTNYMSNNPDVILHQPTTTGQTVYTTPWTYGPSGSRPLQRQDYHSSMKSLNSSTAGQTEQKVMEEKNENVITTWSQPTSQDNMHPGTSAFGSRDWSSNIFASFHELRKKKPLSTALKAFCRDCLCVPCMMCDIAKSLGDRMLLPFIPGTGAAIRFKVRILGGIQGSIADDCLMTSCCCPCSVCQMYREIDDIGLAPT